MTPKLDTPSSSVLPSLLASFGGVELAQFDTLVAVVLIAGVFLAPILWLLDGGSSVAAGFSARLVGVMCDGTVGSATSSVAATVPVAAVAAVAAAAVVVAAVVAAPRVLVANVDTASGVFVVGEVGCVAGGVVDVAHGIHLWPLLVQSFTSPLLVTLIPGPIMQCAGLLQLATMRWPPS